MFPYIIGTLDDTDLNAIQVRLKSFEANQSMKNEATRRISEWKWKMGLKKIEKKAETVSKETFQEKFVANYINHRDIFEDGSEKSSFDSYTDAKAELRQAFFDSKMDAQTFIAFHQIKDEDVQYRAVNEWTGKKQKD